MNRPDALPAPPFCASCGGEILNRESSRPTCGACARIAYRNPIVGVAAIVRDRAGRVLLGQRASGPYEGLWCIPCGFVEWGEDVREAAARELQEETGIEARIGKVVAVHSNFHNPEVLTVGIWFSVDTVMGESSGRDGEFSDLQYFAPDNPPPLAFPTDALVLAQIAAPSNE